MQSAYTDSVLIRLGAGPREIIDSTTRLKDQVPWN